MSKFHQIYAAPHRTVQIEQKEWLYFSGTAYLGVQQHPQFLHLLTKHLGQYGSNFGGSRRSNIRFQIIEVAEELLAAVTTAPAALTFSSGTLAGQVLVQYLQQLNLPFHYAPNTHPALHQPNVLNLPLQFMVWAKEIVRAAQQQQPFLMLCNAVDPLRCEPMWFDWLWDLPADRQHTLIVDDSHGIGVTGEQGGGFYERIELPDWVDLIVVASLGKAYGITGGAILGKQKHIAALQASTFFGGASPISPALLATFVAAQTLYHQQRELLQQRIRQFHTQPDLDRLFCSLKDYPVFYTEKVQLAAHLAENNIMISQFPYPNPQDDLITRVIINAAHTEQDIEQLQSAINNFPIQ